MGIRQADAEMLSHCFLDAAVMGCKWEMGRWAQEEKATGGWISVRALQKVPGDPGS